MFRLPDSRLPTPDSRFPIPYSRFPTPINPSQTSLTQLIKETNSRV
ncbi:MAG: hypothetical protein F6J94_31505 [Moorea sp. SIO1F2]|nr:MULTISPECIES: hypothetical protein [unclassified Moorena]NEO23623.1 hypothetical protein [Moorena sp. SIO4A5]NEQ62117.1 hypothetical protein [Moorena sp. SIO4A1]NET86236.1 hypothetical protein [Moorena sp. SIO1F2]